MQSMELQGSSYLLHSDDLQEFKLTRSVFCLPLFLDMIDIQLSSVSRLNANVAVGEPVEIALIETTIHEASQISLAALHPIPFVSNLLFTLFTKEIMSKYARWHISA